MTGLKLWLTQKFRDWEKEQGKSQSYYAFAHYLGVSQSALSAWMDGAVEPGEDDLALLANKLGPEVYGLVGTHPLTGTTTADAEAVGLGGIPAGLRERLLLAVQEAAVTIRERHVEVESVDAKKIAVEVFARRGIRLTS